MGKQSGRGLALAEIIIAIGVLAVVSVFVLEMFVRASNITNKAQDKDRAGYEAQAVVETYRTHGQIENLSASQFDRGVVRTSSAAGDTETYEIYYTRDFAPAAARDDKGYVLTLTVTPQKNVGNVANARGLWKTLTVSVVRLSPYLMADEESVEILRLETGVYLPGGEAVAS